MGYAPRKLIVHAGLQKIGGVHEGRFSTPSQSPPILGEKKYIYALVLAPVFGLIFGLVLGLIFTLVLGLVFALILGLIFALVLGLVFGLIRTRTRYDDARSVRISLPKTGEGSGGVDIEEPLFSGS